MSRPLRQKLFLASLSVLAACASSSGDIRRSDLPTPRPHVKLGNPYVVGGERYVPRHDPDYRQSGIASWYGPKFHGKLTANGELFDMDRLTAAHKTLPLPSLVRVTNLENGRKVVVRVNDRGPFAGDRIIDLSREAAEKIGSRKAGLAKVRVEYLGPADINDAIVRLGQKENYAALKPKRKYSALIADEPQNAAGALFDAAPVIGEDGTKLRTKGATLYAEAQASNPDTLMAAQLAAAAMPVEVDTVTFAANTSSAGAPIRYRGATPFVRPEAAETVEAEGPSLSGLRVTGTSGMRAASPSLAGTTTDGSRPAVFASMSGKSAAPTKPRKPDLSDTIKIVRNGEVIGAVSDEEAAAFAASGAGYYVQVGVFGVSANAKKTLALFPQPMPVKINQIGSGSKTRHSVRLGPYAHEFAVREAQRAAVARGFKDAHVVEIGLN